LRDLGLRIFLFVLLIDKNCHENERGQITRHREDDGATKNGPGGSVCKMRNPSWHADATTWNCVWPRPTLTFLGAPELPFSDTFFLTIADHGRAMLLPFGG
jgi:hypothetical protein